MFRISTVVEMVSPTFKRPSGTDRRPEERRIRHLNHLQDEVKTNDYLVNAPASEKVQKACGKPECKGDKEARRRILSILERLLHL